MHMADALLSPAVGGAMWAVTTVAAAHSVKKVREEELDESKIPLMGVMGAFVFAAQMINFAIPGTGASGHLGGGLLLAILLGPHAGFITMASILVIQALFFADGGLLALGSNIFNLGFFSCFVAYPLIYRPLTRNGHSPGRLFWGATLAAIIGLQLGSLGVVLETFLSGRTELPLGTFLLLMQPIHLAIGVVEGLVTALLISFVYKARPEILEQEKPGRAAHSRKLLVGFAVAFVLLGGVFSWFASSDPDGLEWAIFHTAGTQELEARGGIYETLAAIQEKTALLPDYSFKTPQEPAPASEQGPVTPGKSASGLLGGLLTLALAAITGLVINWVKKSKKKTSA